MGALTPGLLRRMLVFIEECALGERLDPQGLSHDDNDLMTVARRAVGAGDGGRYVAEALCRRAMTANALWLELNNNG